MANIVAVIASIISIAIVVGFIFLLTIGGGSPDECGADCVDTTAEKEARNEALKEKYRSEQHDAEQRAMQESLEDYLEWSNY